MLFDEDDLHVCHGLLAMWNGLLAMWNGLVAMSNGLLAQNLQWRTQFNDGLRQSHYDLQFCNGIQKENHDIVTLEQKKRSLKFGKKIAQPISQKSANHTIRRNRAAHISYNTNSTPCNQKSANDSEQSSSC